LAKLLVDPSEQQFNWDKMSQTLAKKMHDHFLNHFSTEEVFRDIHFERSISRIKSII